MLSDRSISKAVAKIIQRSERQASTDKLLETYVDIGLVDQLDNENHQIFYGRRGTGKTHLMRVLASELRKQQDNTIVYIDCRTLGSSQQFSDIDLPIADRCLSLFRDFLIAIYSSLLEHIVEFPTAQATEALNKADDLTKIIAGNIQSLNVDKLITSEQYSTTRRSSLEASFGTEKAASVNAGIGVEKGKSGKQETQYTVNIENKVVFPELYSTLSKVLQLAETRLYVLVDEWASLPRDLQPYLAEFFKKGILPVQTVTVKISALEYRCEFNLDSEIGTIGFELGADISTATDLDEYFVFDRNPQKIVALYSDILFRHIDNESPKEYLKHNHMIVSGETLISQMFTEKETFIELARASEGVVRDLINIFSMSFFNSQKRDRNKIDKKSVTESARQWFEKDKAQYLNDPLANLLQRIVADVIGSKKARSFLLRRNLERHTDIQKLFDARILHLMQRGYADKDNPGVRYNIYSIDYGTYVDLIGTSKEPQLELELFEESGSGKDNEVVVPFDDKRSIRRIILDESILD